MNDTLIIIQARSGSTRLPNKVLMPIAGVPLFKRVYDSCCKSGLKTVFAIPVRDRVLEKALVKEKIKYYTGSEDDVLARIYSTAIIEDAESIIRVTCDCALIDPAWIRYIAEDATDNDYDYADNCHPDNRSSCDGNDIQYCTRCVLEHVDVVASSKEDREHVFSHIWKNGLSLIGKRTSVHHYHQPIDQSKLNLSIDTVEDFQRVEAYIKENEAFHG